MRQSTALELAKNITHETCKCKQLRPEHGSGPRTVCCIFVGKAQYTEFYGLTWEAALDKLFTAYCVSDEVRTTLGLVPKTGSDPGKPAVGSPVATQHA